MSGAEIGTEASFVLNTFAFLLWGALVMWMCAGFTMLEAGSVRTKNASMICLKNIGLYSIAGLAYYVIGYNLMYTDVGSVIGSITLFFGSSEAEVALLNATEEGRQAAAATVAEAGYSSMSGCSSRWSSSPPRRQSYPAPWRSASSYGRFSVSWPC